MGTSKDGCGIMTGSVLHKHGHQGEFQAGEQKRKTDKAKKKKHHKMKTQDPYSSQLDQD